MNVFDIIPLSYEIFFDDGILESSLNEFSSLFNSISHFHNSSFLFFFL